MTEYMSREDYCEETCGKENREGYKTCHNCGMLNVPSADVQPVKHGKWIEVTPKHSRCSVCDTTCLIAVYPISKKANYCPNCGAKMKVR